MPPRRLNSASSSFFYVLDLAHLARLYPHLYGMLRTVVSDTCVHVRLLLLSYYSTTGSYAVLHTVHHIVRLLPTTLCAKYTHTSVVVFLRPSRTNHFVCSQQTVWHLARSRLDSYLGVEVRSSTCQQASSPAAEPSTISFSIWFCATCLMTRHDYVRHRYVLPRSAKIAV
ncbi:hypothetical protein F5I97DRAFT_807029 [Phlebopus sp. FC_14]|nr:hypothetical protein F5I97DRAFT_807029 [Phlebopus sp. FC_14]